MAEEDKGGTLSWYKVPTWDGSPQTWHAFKREMSWWQSSLNVEDTKKFNLAARWLLRQSGTVRARGEEFEPRELEYQRRVVFTDPGNRHEVELTPEDPFSGLNKLLKSLEELNGKTALDKRGELRSSFYLDLQRKPNERLADFCTRFTELGWFLKDKPGLENIRRQLLETALQGKETYEDVEIEVLRLFKDLHQAGPLSANRRAQQSTVLLC